MANTLAYYYTATIVIGYLSTIKKYQNHFIIKNWQITSACSARFDETCVGNFHTFSVVPSLMN